VKNYRYQNLKAEQEEGGGDKYQKNKKGTKKEDIRQRATVETRATNRTCLKIVSRHGKKGEHKGLGKEKRWPVIITKCAAGRRLWKIPPTRIENINLWERGKGWATENGL